MACVKGDGYGHGMIKVARAALEGGADRLSVARVEEGVALRRAGLLVPIQILIEPRPEEAEALSEFNLIPSLSSPVVARELARRLEKKIKVHIEIDTGMHRVPLKAVETPAFAEALLSSGRFDIEGIFSHFASSTIPDDEQARELSLNQLAEFNEVVETCKSRGISFPLRHMANTGAVSLYPDAYFDMIRPGFALYGFPVEWIHLTTRPALSWHAHIDTVLPVKGGEGIGYDHNYIPRKDTKIALISAGYADGYPRGLSNLGHAVIQCTRIPLVGLVGMDQMMADVGDIPEVKPGDEVLLIGEMEGTEVNAGELAYHLHTTAAQVTCGITARVERRYLNE